MNEIHYQLDLLKAMNQKLSADEKMYRMLAEITDNAFLYYSFEQKELKLIGKWKHFLKTEVKNIKDLKLLLDMVDEPYVDSLRQILYLEKTGQAEDSVECMLKGRRAWAEFRGYVYYDESGKPTEKVIRIFDITKFKLQNEELTYMAYYDSLTGLYNRNYFVRLLGGFLNKAREEEEMVSVLLIDIDDFRKVNDGLGIIVGDELVQQFGSFLKEISNDDIIVCHLNSDIYCMAIYGPYGEKSVQKIHGKIEERNKKPFVLSGGQELTISVSVGVAEYPLAAQSALELINCAEIVMYKGKALGKHTIQHFDTKILNDFLKNVELETKLKDAIFRSNFEMYYQPQYYAGNKKLRGFEALIRWREDNGHMISPSVFIPIAEKNGAIVSIGNWVIEQSIAQFSKWQQEYGIPFTISVNISAIQYMKDGFEQEFIALINRYGVDPKLVELEITESVLIDDPKKVTEKLRILRDYGMKVSLDDFGTGFSSLSYLRKFPVDTLKIDKSFVDTVLTDTATRTITETIITMVKALGLETVAEGVEMEQQYKYLHAIGCDVIQGYYFGKPQSVSEVDTLLRSLKQDE